MQWGTIIDNAFITRPHIQLMKRCLEPFRFLLGEGQLTPAWLDMLWTASRSSDVAQAEAVTLMLADLAKDMPGAMLQDLLGRVSALPRSQLRTETVSFLCSVAVSRDYLPPEESVLDEPSTLVYVRVAKAATEQLWKLALFDVAVSHADATAAPLLPVRDAAQEKLKVRVLCVPAFLFTI